MKFIYCLLLVLFSGCAFGAEVEWSSRLEGDELVDPSLSTLKIKDGDYALLSSGSFVDVQSFGYIRLGLNNRVAMDYFATSGVIQTVTAHLSIIPYDNSGNPLSAVTASVDMEYLSDNGQIVLDGSDYRMQGVHRFEVTITSVDVNGTPVGSLGNYVYLQAGFYAQRYYQLDALAPPGATTQLISYTNAGNPTLVGTTLTTATTDEIFVNWSYIDGAEQYELEWTWVDNYDPSSFGTPIAATGLSLTETEFKHNSTRIRTGEQFYRIPNIFARGYLVYRIRAVGRWIDDPSKEKFGRWNTGVNATNVSDWQGFVTIAVEHESGKNWQFQSTYAEQGKKKEVTQYFDGSLRGRQTVTRINSDNQSIVGETIYDNEGRGVIQVLPVPQDNPAIKYYPSINEVSANDPFSHQEFDWEDNVATCAPAPSAPLDQSKGAGKYYSVTGYDNTTDQDWQQYVPESNGYAYTQVEYTPDNTGRIRNQSGVGTDHKIGSTHETKYFYLQPSQEELNRLFGYKVGYKTRYKKNMVVDANGQVSVSCLDAQGRVVATAMAGSNQTDFQSLNSEVNGNHVLTQTDLLNKLDDLDPDTGLDDNQLYSTGNFGALEDGLKMETQLGLPETMTYNFEYTILPGVYSEICQGIPGVSYPYVYDLVLSLRDDCGNEVFSQTTYEIGVESIGSATNSALQTITIPPAILNQGSYTLVKTLKVNQASFQNYLEHYLSDDNACLLTTSDFVPEFSTDPCPTSCEECVEELGTLNEFMLTWAQDSLGESATLANLSGSIGYYTGIYQYLKEQCLVGCEPRLTCDSYEGMMLGDVSPGGQYAGLASGTPGNVSVFTSGKWRGADFMPSPFGTGSKNYLDQYGNQVLISAYPIAAEFVPDPANTSLNSTFNVHQIDPIPGVTPVMVEPWQLKREDFLLLFQPSWAGALLSYHPEYPLLEYAQEICNLQWNIPTSGASIPVSSALFDVMIREQINDYTLAGTNPYDINFLTTNPLYDQDPYFNQTYSVHTYSTSPSPTNLTTAKNAMMTYALGTEYKNTGMTLFKFAVKTALYPNDYAIGVPTETWASLTALQKDQVWEKYKFYYLSYKAEINQLLMDLHGYEQTVLSPSGQGIYNGCIGSGAAPNIGALFNFGNSSFIGNPTYSSIIVAWIDFWDLFLPPFDLPDGLCGSEFDDKIARIVRHDVLYNPAMSESEIITQGMQDADYVQWEQTGLCPLTVDVERLLHAMAAKVDQTGTITQASRFTASFNQTTIYEFVPDLYEAFTGINVYAATGSLPNMSISGTTPSGLNINFSAGAPVNTSSNLIISNLTNNAGVTQLNWSNYGTTWDVFGISSSYPTGGANSATQVIVLAGPTFATAQEYIATYTITGAATPLFTNCSALQNPANDPECQREEFIESDLLNILQAIQSGGNLSSTTNIASASYYQNSTLSEILNISGTVNWSPMDPSNFFYIGSASNQLGISLTTPFPTGNFMFTGVNMTLTPSTAIDGSGAITITYIDDNGVVGTLTGSFLYKQGGNHVPLKLDCPCPAGDLVEFINDITYEMLSNPEVSDGTALGTLAQTPYLNYENPVIVNWTNTESGVSFTIYEEEDCIFEADGESLCSGDSCIYTISYPNGFTPESPFTVQATEYIGEGQFSLIVQGDPVLLEISCFDSPICDNCTPDGQLQAPISCTEAYTSYENTMSTHFGMSAYTAGSEEYLVFESEHLIDEQTFCGSAYAYITDAYINYLTNVPSTGIDQPNYLSINEFGATQLGYSNTLLNPVITAYINSGKANPAASNYLTWNEYVAEYMLYNPWICPAAMPDPYINLPELAENPCNQWEDNIAIVNAFNQHTIYLNQMAEAFTQAYIDGALSSVVETFKEDHLDKEYHYTLYYYDRAGNLIQTVPPKGVHRFEYDASGAPIASNNGETADLHTAINNYRVSNPDATANGTSPALLAPNHSFQTEYLYNSLNQLVYQNTPDGGESKFAYDKLGRLVVSQNAKQLLAHQFSYTLYDELGRVIEVGEMTTTSNLLTIDEEGRIRYTSSNALFDVNTLGWINIVFGTQVTAREEVTRTIYDELGSVQATFNNGTELSAAYTGINVSTLFGTNYAWDNTRNRIVGVIYQEDYNASLNQYESGTFYDYDVHGNVKHLIQVSHHDPLMRKNQNIKHVLYTYDLVSGNVDQVSYQPNQLDQFFHRYNYDSDNRITIAETSKDGVIWEKDAKYFYYEHGPLARTEIGEKKVQAVDYAYTIQGWLKTVNGEEIDHNSMMGQDGKVASLNSQNARDAFGFSLSYFDNDYESYSNDVIHNLSYGVANTNPSLYNGNIRTMYTALVDLDEQALGTHQTDYGYDQLNRIKSMEGTFHLTGGSIIPSGYSSNYSFDENGNLQTLQRTIPGTSTPFLMDNFTYDYTSGNNQLENVNDAVTTTSTMGLGDIQNGQDNALATGGPNYQYDDIGQLLKDKQEKIVSIDWKVTNKVEQINFDMDGDLTVDKTIHFDYDPMGNRIAKHVTENAVTTSSFYTLDAQGNVMSIYGFTFIDGESSLLLKERNLYGSSRLGLEEVNIAMPFRTLTQTVELEDYYLAQNYTGDKRYELANHLGNVLEVITDRKLPSEHPTDPGTTQYYTADVIAFNDYYPYGMLLPYSCRDVPVSSCGTVIGQVQGTIVDDQFTSDVDHWVCSNPIAEVVPENGKLRFNYPLRYTSFYRYHKAVIGQTYTITFDFDMGNTPNVPGGFGFGIEGASPVYYALNSSGTYTYTYVATSETMKILFSAPNVTACPLDAQGNNTNCYYFLIDNVKVDGASEVISCPKNYVVNNEFTSGAPNWEKTVSYMNDPVVVNDYLEVTPYSRYTGIKKSFATQVGTKYYVEFAMDAQDFNRLEYRVYNETTGATVTDYFVQSGDNYFTFVAQHTSTTISFTAPDDYSPTSSKTFKLHEIQVYDYGTESGTMELCYGNAQEGDYRYGFNGMEADDEVKEQKGTHLDFGARCYDSRVGRWLSRDALEAKKPALSPYQAFKCSPILFVDPDGKDEFISIVIKDKTGKIVHKVTGNVSISNKVRAGAIREAGNSTSIFEVQKFYDFRKVYTATMNADGSLEIDPTPVYYTLTDRKRYTKTMFSSIVSGYKTGAIVDPDEKDWTLGNGQSQNGGYTLTSPGGGGASPTKTRSLSAAEEVDVSKFLEVLGTLKNGSLGNADADKINDFVSLFSKTEEVKENLKGNSTTSDNFPATPQNGTNPEGNVIYWRKPQSARTNTGYRKPATNEQIKIGDTLGGHPDINLYPNDKGYKKDD